MNPIINTLPYDSQIEYLESTGTQYIDTGISGGTNVEYSVDFQFLSGSSRQYQHMFGSVQPPEAPKLYYGNSSDNGLRIQYNGNNYYNIVSPPDYNRHLFVYKNGSIYCDNNLKINNIGNLGFGNLNFYLFDYPGGSNLGCKGRIYSTKISKDGLLVRDFIPVRVGQVGYMYDKVSGELFGNAGTGDFILGNDVYSSFIKGVGSAARGFAVGSSEVEAMYIGETKIYKLPYDAKIEYLESSGTQYVLTEIKPKIGDIYRIDTICQYSQNVESNTWLTGWYTDSNNSSLFGTYQSQIYFTYNVDNNITKSNQGLTLKHHIRYNYDGIFIDDQSLTSSVNNTPLTVIANMPHGLPIFCRYTANGYLSGIRAKVYHFIIQLNDKIVFYGIPVRVGDVGYMYDKVSKQLFGNAGSGSFTLGPDL